MMTRFTIIAIVALITTTAHAQGLVPYYGPDGQVYYRSAPDPGYAPPGASGRSSPVTGTAPSRRLHPQGCAMTAMLTSRTISATPIAVCGSSIRRCYIT